MKHHQSNLVGTFLVLETTDHEHYRAGHIAAAVGNCYLIQFEKVEEPEEHPLPPHGVVRPRGAVPDLRELWPETCQFVREDMMRWIAWLNQPESPQGDPARWCT